MNKKIEKFFDTIEYNKKDADNYIILLMAPLFLSVYWYFGTVKAFGTFFPDMKSNPLFDFYGAIYQYAFFFFFMFIIPFVFIKTKMKKSMKDFGFGIGDKKFGLIFLVIVIPIIAVVIYFSAKMPDIQQEYPISKIIISRHDLVIWHELSYILFYYIAWEFFFRGFMLFGLKDKFGGFNAILIQTIASCLIHLGKPSGETLGSIFYGVLFGAIALRTRSIWYVLIAHIVTGVLTDLFVVFCR